MDMIAEILNSQEGTVALGIAAIGGICAFICAFLDAPTADSSKLYKVVYALLNWAGMNLGKAKNADDVAAKKEATTAQDKG